MVEFSFGWHNTRRISCGSARYQSQADERSGKGLTLTPPQAEFALSICYDFSMLLGKLSVLALLARVFTLHAKWFKIGIYFWTTWTLLWWTAGCLLVFLQCRPLSTNWGVPFQCRPSFTTSISTATLNAISDLGVLLLPQPLIWNLQLPMKRKLQVSLLFLVGGLYVSDPVGENLDTADAV